MPAKRDRRKSAKLILEELMLEKLHSSELRQYLDEHVPGCLASFDLLEDYEKLDLVFQIDKPIGKAVYDFFYSVNNWSGIVHGYMYGMLRLRKRLKEVIEAKEDVADIAELFKQYKRDEKSLVEAIEYVEKRHGK